MFYSQVTMIQKDDNYTTTDLSLATTLSLYFPLEDIDKTIPRKSIFIFKNSKKLEELVEKYYRNEIKVSPLTYFNQLRVIKARLYE